MAPSRVMTSSSKTNSDRSAPPQSASFSSISIPIGHHHQSKNLPSVTMDDILKNIYVDSLSPDVVFGNGDADKMTTTAAANDVWKEMAAGTGQIGGDGAEMTLEEYLTKTPAVGLESPSAMLDQFQDSGNSVVERSGLVIGNGCDVRVVGGVRGKRKKVDEPVVDKATQQKQKRMIKNRESAARSRERKQQYTNELEKQVSDLEEERAQLLREEAEERNHRRRWLIENIIPVEEKQRPRRHLRRTRSTEL